jgi:hypothetical protein
MVGLWNCPDARPAISTEAVFSALVQLRRPFRQLEPGERRSRADFIQEKEGCGTGIITILITDAPAAHFGRSSSHLAFSHGYRGA